MQGERYILTLSCPDVRGIVASVSGFLAREDGFIIESAQFGDPSTGRFFMRVEFAAGPASAPEQAIRERFRQEVGAPFSMEWALHAKARRLRVLVMVSRIGHCLNDLLYRYRTDQLPVEIPAVVSNHDDFQGVAEWHGIPFYHFPLARAEDKPAQEAKVTDVAQKYAIDTVVLARYMQVLSSELVDQLSGRALNIHHSFLPSFKGARPYHQAYDRGVKLIGATAHYVTSQLDEGPIIEQEVARVDHAQNPSELAAIGRDIECLVLARALRLHAEHRVLMNGNKTVVFR